VLAASVMSEIRTALRAYLAEGHEPPAVMALLNDMLVSMERRRSATAAIVELDLERGELQVVSAGHPPALLVDPDGAPMLLEHQGGLPLGVMAGSEYTSARFRFDAGSALLMYTDGLIERRGESIDDGLRRLAEAGRRAAAGEEASFADRVYRALVDETPLDDDVALLAIESLALGASVQMTLDARPAVLAGLRSVIGRWLINAGGRADEVFGVALATSEAAANAIEHAYGAHDGTFTVQCETDGAQARVVVRDTGRWRETHPHGRGRGLELMRSLVDEVDVQRGDDGTTVTLTRRLAGAAG